MFEEATICTAIQVFADTATGPFWLAQWQAIALGFEPAAKGNARRLVDALRAVADEAPPVVRGQIIDRQEALSAAELRTLETALHAITCRLFALTPIERRMVEQRR